MKYVLYFRKLLGSFGNSNEFNNAKRTCQRYVYIGQIKGNTEVHFITSEFNVCDSSYSLTRDLCDVNDARITSLIYLLRNHFSNSISYDRSCFAALYCRKTLKR
jgi:hypothetical protein